MESWAEYEFIQKWVIQKRQANYGQMGLIGQSGLYVSTSTLRKNKKSLAQFWAAHRDHEFLDVFKSGWADFNDSNLRASDGTYICKDFQGCQNGITRSGFKTNSYFIIGMYYPPQCRDNFRVDCAPFYLYDPGVDPGTMQSMVSFFVN